MSVGRTPISVINSFSPVWPYAIQIILVADATSWVGMDVCDDGNCLIRSIILVKSCYPCIVAHIVAHPVAFAGHTPLVLSP